MTATEKCPKCGRWRQFQCAMPLCPAKPAPESRCTCSTVRNEWCPVHIRMSREILENKRNPEGAGSSEADGREWALLGVPRETSSDQSGKTVFIYMQFGPAIQIGERITVVEKSRLEAAERELSRLKYAADPWTVSFERNEIKRLQRDLAAARERIAELERGGKELLHTIAIQKKALDGGDIPKLEEKILALEHSVKVYEEYYEKLYAERDQLRAEAEWARKNAEENYEQALKEWGKETQALRAEVERLKIVNENEKVMHVAERDLIFDERDEAINRAEAAEQEAEEQQRCNEALRLSLERVERERDELRAKLQFDPDAEQVIASKQEHLERMTLERDEARAKLETCKRGLERVWVLVDYSLGGGTTTPVDALKTTKDIVRETLESAGEGK